MTYSVYILQSDVTGKYYCGQTDNVRLRLDRHNKGEVKSTKHGLPWRLFGFIICSSRSEAMQVEKRIKKRGIERWLLENEYKLER